ncbi:Periplasmic pH-dependent serine endoprotease DegQ [anaerobic digester metagenome]
MVQRAYLGADIVDITAATAKQYGLSSMKGVYVSAVSDGGAASEAGIEAGDVILSVGGEEVNSSSRLLELIAEKHPGDKLLLEIERGNKTISKPVTLLNRRGEKVLLKKEDPALSTFMGATFSEPDQQTMSRLRLKNGMQISELNEGALKNAGIKESFIVTKIDQTIIYSMEDIENALSGKSGGVLIEGVYPNGMKAYYGFGL